MIPRIDSFRRSVLLLLLMALPMQGAFAASRWICAASANGEAGISASGGHAHGHVPTAGAAHGHDGVAAAMNQQEHQPPHHHDVSLAEVDPIAPTDSPQASDSCSRCAACCVTAATAPASPTPAVMATVHADFPLLSARVPDTAADGPERPPRTL